ncbi:hypothetical protein QR680_018218 [Steinernema hermaphroditum]|uniref:Nuclear receptor domain-containing protein n=1 Tax=Steinernema hermaphroditum TaxID=289476 RepID=A0AA39LQ03_9BILA|nr:hypothetical protein QR680_018218 [Steinernema hermaphroditum]
MTTRYATTFADEWRKCLVCESDKTVGKNFGAFTCASCAAFFRRAIKRNERLKKSIKRPLSKPPPSQISSNGDEFSLEEFFDLPSPPVEALLEQSEAAQRVNILEPAWICFNELVNQRRMLQSTMPLIHNIPVFRPWLKALPLHEISAEFLVKFTRELIEVDREPSLKLMQNFPMIKHLDQCYLTKIHNTFMFLFYVADLSFRTVQLFPADTSGMIAIADQIYFNLGTHCDSLILQQYPLVQFYHQIFQQVIESMRNLRISSEEFTSLLMLGTSTIAENYDFHKMAKSRKSLKDFLYDLNFKKESRIDLVVERIRSIETLACNVETLDPMYTCLVCSEASDGLHFGIYACRACAAFFRRSVLQQRKYVCRRDDNCPIGNDARNMCRSCRFKKCIKLGMSTKKCTKDPPHLINILAEQPQPSTSKGSPSDSEPMDLSLAGMVPRLPKPPVSTTISVISSSFPPPITPFIDQMLKGYENLIARRRIIHRSTDNFGNKHPVKLYDPNIMGMVPGDNDISLASVRVEISLLVDMLNDYFFPFSSFTEREKIYMFREFLGHYLTLDPIYNTAVMFPERGDKRVYITEQRYFNVDCMEDFYKCQNNYTDPKKSAHYLSPIYNNILKFVKEPIVKLQVTKAELVAIYGLSLYTNDDCDSLSERCTEAQKAARQAIYRELFQLCKLKGNEVAAAHRMGEIIGLITPVVKICRRFKETFELIEVFNMFEVDDVVFQFIKKTKQ